MTFEDTQLFIERSNISLRQKVVDVLRDAITEGRFAPGSRLVERELCALTGVSRTSVREALRHLEAEGLVKSITNRGPIVADLSPQEARNIYDIREALESLAARRFAEQGSDEQIGELTRKMARMNEALASGDHRGLAAATNDLYDFLLKSCGNEIISDVIRGLRARVGFLRSKSTSVPGRSQTSVAEVEEIVGAIARRDPQGAADASALHVRNACKAALSVLEDAKRL